MEVEEIKKLELCDRVFHRNLKTYGAFDGYDYLTDEECFVNFETEDGSEDSRHVSSNWIERADE